MEWKIYPDMKPVELPAKAGSVFKEITNKIQGATYMPLLLCGRREVADGMNYMFYCKQTLPTFDPEGHVIQMVVHKPNDGDAVVVGIKRLF